jgi:hypothetical protein
MCGKGSCLCLGRFLSTKYTRIISVFHSSLQQAILLTNNTSINNIADAPGLHFPLSSPSKGEDKGEGDNGAGRSRAIGLACRDQSVACFL